MSQSVSCGAPYCRRRVRPDYQYYPYCFDHKDMAQAQREAPRVSEEEALHASLIKNLIPAGSASPVDRTSNTIADVYGLDRETAYAIALTTEQHSQRLGDLTVPNNSNRGNVSEYMADLARNGVDPNRLRIVNFRGCNLYNEDARDYNERIMRFPQVERSVICLDGGTGQELIIDPYMSSTAISRNPSLPLEDDIHRFPSGRTPFADSPWIGRDSEYRDGALLHWDSRSDDPDAEEDEINAFPI